MNKIIVENLSKKFKIANRSKGFTQYLFNRKYKTVNAVDNLNFSIEQGELVGYIGPNGAGKSTSIKILTGILTPTHGEVYVFGNVPYKKRKENAKKIGVVFGQRTQLWWDLPVSDSFELLKRIYKIPDRIFKDNYNKFIEVLELDKFIDTPVRQLSLGQRMRADLAASLLHNPEILFLDEPTIGLDVVVKKKIRSFIKDMRNERDITVILTTHDMKDVEEICDRIILINHGEIIIDFPVDKIKSRLGGVNTIIIDFDKEPLTQINIPNIKIVSKNNSRWIIEFDKKKIAPQKIISDFMKISTVKDIILKEPEIEDIIRKLYIDSKKNPEQQ